MPRRPPSSPLHPVSCESCDAPIFFAATAGRKVVPVDAARRADGSVAVSQDTAGTWHARILRSGEEPGPHEHRHMAHWATCDHPEAFRRRQRRLLAADLARDGRQHRRRPHPDSSPAVVQPSLFEGDGT